MRTISSVKKDIEFNQGHAALIEALKNIAVAQFKVHEQKLKSFEKIILTVEDFFGFIDTARLNHPFLRPQNALLGVVAVTSDSGLLGGLNLKVINQALLELEKAPGKLMVIGACGRNYLRESKFSFIAFGGINDDQRYGQAMQLRDYCLERIMEGSFGSLKIVYPRPVSFTVQRIETLSLLPFTPLEKHNEPTANLILESSLADLVQYLISIWLGQKFYDIFGLSRLSEFAARFVHLEESSQKLKEVEISLKLQYFHLRHELIDRNMRELYSARLLYT